MGPFFSIILPTYNSELSLKTTLDSLLNQTYSNFEIVLMDGGSKDATITIAESYNDYRIKIHSDSDRGVYDAMNKGMGLAIGDWLYFIGSDDYLYTNTILSTLSKKLQNEKNDVLYGNVLIHGNTGWATDGQIYNGKFSFQKLLKSNICHQSMFYRRRFIVEHQLQYDLKYPISSDWDFNISCRALTNFTYVPHTVAVFNAGGVSSTTTAEKEPFLLERKIKYAHLYQKYKPTLMQRVWRKFKKLITLTK
jgi:glycosyltransferase involved in cell wall biosynthesis